MSAEWDAHIASNPKHAWHDLLQEERGAYVCNLANAATILRHAPEFAGMLGFDEMQRDLVVIRNPPGAKIDKATPRPFADLDVSTIQEWMQRNGVARMPREAVQQAVALVASEHSYHPIKDYLDGLAWDGEERLSSWLATYLGAEANAYHSEVGRLFLISMVARIYWPGCKADYMLILQGDQGILKSSACAVLAGKWFSDNLPDLHYGDAVRLSMHLRGKWLIEIGELSSFGKADSLRLKEFLSQTTERYVPKHAHNEVTELRQCVFIGTTNKQAYLRDETGDRRFWPAPVFKADLERLTNDRDQLFAEAATLFRAEAKWYPDRDFELKHIKPVQEEHYVSDVWEESIANWLGTQWRVTIGQVAQEALQMGVSRLGTADQGRVRNALTRLGWERERDDTGKEKRGTGGMRFYVRCE